jgi:hypothetical protein
MFEIRVPQQDPDLLTIQRVLVVIGLLALMVCLENEEPTSGLENR